MRTSTCVSQPAETNYSPAERELAEKNMKEYMDQIKQQLKTTIDEFFSPFISKNAFGYDTDSNINPEYQRDLKDALEKFFEFFNGLDLSSFSADQSRICRASKKTNSSICLRCFVPVLGPYLGDSVWSKDGFVSKYRETVKYIEKCVKNEIRDAAKIAGQIHATIDFESVEKKFDEKWKGMVSEFDASNETNEEKRRTKIIPNLIKKLNAAAKEAIANVLNELDKTLELN